MPSIRPYVCPSCLDPYAQNGRTEKCQIWWKYTPSHMQLHEHLKLTFSRFKCATTHISQLIYIHLIIQFIVVSYTGAVLFKYLLRDMDYAFHTSHPESWHNIPDRQTD